MEKKMNAALSLALVALLSLSLSTTAFADQPPDNVQGNWTIYSTNVNNGETVVKHVQIEQYGNRLTGYFEGPDQSGPIEGEINGHRIRFSTVTKNVLNFGGQVYGNQMSGSYGIHGKHAAWQAVRETPVSTVAPPATGVVYASQPVLAPPMTAPASVAVSQASPAAQTDYNSMPAPLSSDQLNALVAPIALYPDSLVAQVLAAAASPDQVTSAEDWLTQNSNLTGASLAQAVDQQNWDPSVKALTQFPTVLQMLAKNLAWTSSLGHAFENQQADVMADVQTMRAKAQAAGTLQSNSQITVVQQSSSTIVIQPANPQVVYVPQYNPAVVFGAPVVVPYYTPTVAVASAAVTFGSGISIGAFFGTGAVVAGPVYPWGFHAWALNWGGGGGNTIIYNHNTYISNNWRNYNGYRPWANGAAESQNHAWYGGNGTFHPDGSYRPGADTHYGPNGAYHPNGYFGPDGGWHPEAPGTHAANDGPVNHAGGATGSENNAYYANNGTFHPDANWHPGTDTHYGPDGQYRANGYYGQDGGWHPDVNHAGGATGTENPGSYDKNGTYHPDPGYHPGADTQYGPDGAYHPNGHFGPDGGWHNTAPGTGGTQNAKAGNTTTPGNSGQLLGQNRNDGTLSRNTAQQPHRSSMSGDGRAARAESERGHASMHQGGTQRAAMHQPHVHESEPHGGGGGRRR